MAHRWTNTLTHKDVTPKALWMNRRSVLAGLVGAGALGGTVHAQDALEPNTLEEIRSYNNYYEFGTGKSDPSTGSAASKPGPWSFLGTVLNWRTC